MSIPNGNGSTNGYHHHSNGSAENGHSNGHAEVEWLPVDRNFATTVIHSGYDPKDFKYAPVTPPISLSVTFKQEGPAQHQGFDYTRGGNPTRQILEQTLAAMEKAKYAKAYSSGLGATINVATMLNSGDNVICCIDVYGGTGRLFRKMKETANITTDFVDITDLKEFKKALKPETKLVWLETPSNPTLKVIDIEEACKIAHEYSKDIICVVDNTFLTSYYQRPLELGADIVHYSLTKYMNGHSDVLMGALIMNDEELNKKLSYLHYTLGAVPSPFDCYLVIRGLKTLHVRMPCHMKNGLAVARFLEKHPMVDKVLHPGLPSHPQHSVALKQSSGHSGLVSFYIKPGCGSAEKFLQNLKYFILAESLGGFESLAEMPSTMTHASVPADLREKLGITEHLIRLSVGLETDTDLMKDLDQALKNC